MPVTKSAAKALRNQKRKRKYNLRAKKKAKEAIKRFKDSPNEKNLQTAYSAIDKAAKRNVYHQNKAARLKSQLAKKLPKKKTSTKKKASSSKKTDADKMSKEK